MNETISKIPQENPLSNRIPWYMIMIVVLLLIVSVSLLGYEIYKLGSRLAEPSTVTVPDTLQNYLQHIRSAESFWNQGDYEGAIREGELALNLSETSNQKSLAHYYIGAGYYYLGDLDEARYHEEVSILLNPNLKEAHVMFGSIMLDKGDIQKAKEAAQKSIEIDPDYGWGHNLLGLVLAEDGQKEQATYHIKKAISLEPRNADFKKSLKYVEERY